MGVADRDMVGATRPALGRSLPGLDWLVGSWPLPAVLLLSATALRWPLLLEWPPFTDESREILLSLAVAHGERWPLTGFDAYIGPLHTYLLAGFFAVFGSSIMLPRGLVMGLNLLAVGFTYLIGRRVGGQATGLLAAGWVALSPMWIVVNSHVAWSGSTTPTYIVAMALAAQRALESDGRRAGWWLVGAGFLLGLAGQTHPTALLIAPGLALAVLASRRGLRWLGSPWPWLGLLAALIASLPLIIVNLVMNPGRSITEASAVGYAWAPTLDPLVYSGRAPRMWWAALSSAAGSGNPIDLADWPTLFPVMAALLFLLLVGAGAAIVWRRGQRTIPLLLISQPLLLPVITSYSGDFFADRYFAPQIALLAVLVGVSVTQLAKRWWWAAGTAGLALLLLPTVVLANNYQHGQNSPNTPAIATAEQLISARGCIIVGLDQALNYYDHGGNGTTLRALRLTLSLAGIRWETKRFHAQTMRDLARDAGAAGVAILVPTTAELPNMKQRLRQISSVRMADGLAYDVYMYRLPGLPVCAPDNEAKPTTIAAIGTREE